MSLASKIRQVLATEKSRRHPGVADGLCGLEDVPPFVPLDEAADGSVPILRAQVSARPCSAREYHVAADKAIWRFLGRGGSSLARGFVVAGGAPGDLLMRGKIGNDIDVFIVGQSRERAMEFIRGFGSGLSGRVPRAAIRVYRTVRCVTFVATRRDSRILAKIQLILRLYQTVSEVLHGFDLGASKVADDGERLYFTAEGRFAYEHGLNIANPAVRRASYEHRLRKYWARGFGIALPDFCATAGGKPDGGYLIEMRLPFITLKDVVYDSATKILRARGILLTPGIFRPSAAPLDPARGRVVARRRVGNRGGDRDEEYESWSHFEYGADDRALGARNMRAALQGRTEALCAVAEFARGLDVTAIQATVYKLVGRRIERQMDRCLNYSGKLLDRPNMPLRDAGDLPNMAIGALTANLRIPFRLSGLSETAFELSEVDGQVEQSVWYGAYYAHPPAPRALAAELFDGLLLPDLALLVVEYTGSPVPAGVCGICRIPGVLVGSGEEVWCFRCGTLHGEAEEDLPLLVPVAWLRAERPDRCDTCGVSPPFRSAEKWCRCRERRDHERKGVEEGEEELPMDPGFESWTEHGPDALPGAPERAAVEPRQEAPGF